MSVQDAIEAAEPGDTVHLLPGFYKVRQVSCRRGRTWGGH